MPPGSGKTWAGAQIAVLTRNGGQDSAKNSCPLCCSPPCAAHKCGRMPAMGQSAVWPVLGGFGSGVGDLGPTFGPGFGACGEEYLEGCIGKHDGPHITAIRNQTRRSPERALPLQKDLPHPWETCYAGRPVTAGF